jgi:formate/nitrite transporter FocA (FNT family)
VKNNIDIGGKCVDPRSGGAGSREMNLMIKSGKFLLNAFFAGLFIGVAGTVFLSVPNPVVGAVLFGFGLLGILVFNFKLYPGAVGYMAVQSRREAPGYFYELILIWLGNLAGCFTVGTLIRHTRMFAGISERVAAVSAAKLGDGNLSLLILAFFCGMLMFTAVDVFKKEHLPAPARVVMVFLCVVVFILSGFEHCIANMYYFSAAAVWNLDTLLAVLVMTLGNSLGGMLIPACDKLRKL